MEPTASILTKTEIQEAISSSNQNPKSVECWRCFGVGVRLIANGKPVRAGKHNGDVVVMARNCKCVLRKIARTQLAIVPPVFNKPRLSRLNPRLDLHPEQAKAITFIRANPNDSYLFVGKNGTGKSHIAWALYRHAVSQRRPVVACTVRDLLADFRRVEVGVPDGETMKSPRVTADTLRRPSKPWFVFLDEFEKARPSEFASEQLFNLLDAARSFRHQLVITSNFPVDALRSHWGRIDEIWGNSIMTRLQDCNQVDFF